MKLRRNTARALAASAVLGAVLLAMPVSQALGDDGTTTATDTVCGLVAFEKASVVTGGKGAPPILVVSGYTPSLGYTVTLKPLVYVQKPVYWGIEVVGCGPRIGLPAVQSYTAALDISRTLGSKGVAVIGAQGIVELPVSGASTTPTNTVTLTPPATPTTVPPGPTFTTAPPVPTSTVTLPWPTSKP